MTQFIKIFIATTILVSTILGCSSAGIQSSSGQQVSDVMSTFTSGDIRLSCGVTCSGAWGSSRKSAKGFYENALWDDLAHQVTKVGFETDLTYFYLGRAAEGLGKTKAARIYYKLALSKIHKCDGLFNNCDGFSFPNDINNRLKPIESEIVKEKLAAEKLAAEKLAAEKLAAEKLAAEKLAAEKLAAEKLAAEKLAAEKLAAEKLAAEKLAAEKLAAEKLAAKKLAAEKLAAKKLAKEESATIPTTKTDTYYKNPNSSKYGECKSFCAEKFRECITYMREISPEDCANVSNNCLYQCKSY